MTGRSRRRGRPIRVSNALRRRLLTAKHQTWLRKHVKRQGGLCSLCHKVMKIPSLDHTIPVSRGGEDHWENTSAACSPCNARKGDRLPEEIPEGFFD